MIQNLAKLRRLRVRVRNQLLVKLRPPLLLATGVSGVAPPAPVRSLRLLPTGSKSDWSALSHVIEGSSATRFFSFFCVFFIGLF